MITVYEVILLVGFGVLLALACVSWGVIIHMRYLDRRPLPPHPKPAPKPGNGVTV